MSTDAKYGADQLKKLIGGRITSTLLSKQDGAWQPEYFGFQVKKGGKTYNVSITSGLTLTLKGAEDRDHIKIIKQ